MAVEAMQAIDGRQARSMRTIARMLEAGALVLREVGSVDELSVSMVCERAGASRSSMYNSFGSQAAFLIALHEQLNRQALERIGGEPIQAGGNRTTRRGLEALLSSAVDFSAQHLWFVARMHPLIGRDPAHASLHAELERGLASVMHRSLVEIGYAPAFDTERRRRLVAWTVVTSSIRGTGGRVPFLDPDSPAESSALCSLAGTLESYAKLGEVDVPVEWVEKPQHQSRLKGCGAVRERILDAAEGLLVERRDSSDVTVLEVSIAADTSQSVIYDNFGSRLGLIQAVLDRMLDESVALSIDAMPDPDGNDVTDVLHWTCKAYCLLHSMMAARMHALGAFETPDRVGPGIGRALAGTEEVLIRAAIRKLPGWVGASDSVDDVVVAVRLSKAMLQGAFFGPTAFASELGYGLSGLTAQLAAMTTCRLDAPLDHASAVP